MFSNILNYVKGLDLTSWIIIVIGVLAVIGLYINRKRKFVKDLVKTAVVNAEKSFNSNQGQEKLDFATEYIKSRLPVILKYFISKRMIVSMIESTLNKLCDIFEVDEEVDIIGNEDIKKVDITEKSVGVEFSSNTEYEPIKDKNTEVYASLKAETDLHDNPELKAEIGIKHKF